MSLASPLPASAPFTLPLARAARLRAWCFSHGPESLALLFPLALLAADRYALGRDYLFQYTDEDQTCMWYAAHDLLAGRIAEPCFYGQDYNSCLEGWLAAPLVALGAPYHIACPLVTLLLGLLPFLLLAFAAWRRRCFLTAFAALLVPLLLPIRYAMITGIPRGFINGIALAAIVAWLLLPRLALPSAPSPQTPPRTRRRFRALLRNLRFFAAGALAIIALQTNPNCALLLGPVALYAALTHFLQWRFWLFALLGVTVALPYPWWVWRFYHVAHPDYVLYLRDVHYQWGYSFFKSYLAFAAPRAAPSPVFSDLVPFFIDGRSAAACLVITAAALVAWSTFRLRPAALLAALAAIALTLASFAFERIATGVVSNTASYPYSRMFLALPVLAVWLLLLANLRPWRWWPQSRYRRLATAAALLALCAFTAWLFTTRQRQRPAAISAEVRAPGFVICPAIPVAQLQAYVFHIEKVAREQHADLLVIGGGDRIKHLAYALPALTGIETLFPQFERRTHRLYEEFARPHDTILLLDFPVPSAQPASPAVVLSVDPTGHVLTPTTSMSSSPHPPGTRTVIVPPLTLLSLHHHTPYDTPSLAPRLPAPIALQPLQFYRPPWAFR